MVILAIVSLKIFLMNMSTFGRPTSLGDHSPDDQCIISQNYSQVKDLFKVQGRLTHFNVMDDEKFSCQSWVQSQIWCKFKYPQFSVRAIKILLCFPTSYLSEAGFFFFFNTLHLKQHYHNRMKTEAGMKIHLLLNQILRRFAKM